MKNEIKENLKEIFLMGLGAISLTGDKAKELKDELLEKGKELYATGQVKNEELKHAFKEKIKDNITIVYENKNPKDDIMASIKNMNAEDLEEIKEYLNKENGTK